MIETSSGQRFERLVQAICPGGTLTAAWPLEGGVSAEVTAVAYREPDGTSQTVVVRRHGRADLSANAHVARDEFNLLQIVRRHGVAAPEQLYLDESGSIFPTPVVVFEYVDGRVDFEPSDLASFVDQAASELARIHAIAAGESLAFLPGRPFHVAAPRGGLDESMSETLIREALRRVTEPELPDSPSLLHGDYWPGNWLWRDGRLQAIIDWEDAGTGDPLSDLANCRLELLWATGQTAMEQFTERYLALTGIEARHLPAWDLWVALRPCGAIHGWGLSADEYERMRSLHRRFVEQAMSAAGGGT